MRINKEYVAPRTGATHGLYGMRFLKHHNMRDIDWTSEDLITQYERLSNIFRKFGLKVLEGKEFDTLLLFQEKQTMSLISRKSKTKCDRSNVTEN